MSAMEKQEYFDILENKYHSAMNTANELIEEYVEKTSHLNKFYELFYSFVIVFFIEFIIMFVAGMLQRTKGINLFPNPNIRLESTVFVWIALCIINFIFSLKFFKFRKLLSKSERYNYFAGIIVKGLKEISKIENNEEKIKKFYEAIENFEKNNLKDKK